MIKIFRKIRKNLLNEGKTAHYLKYAVGEIVLVVIGILIALQINDWNQRRLDRINEDRYLLAIIDEINSNNEFNKDSFLIRVDEKLKGLNLAKAYAEDRLEVTDIHKFINRVSFGAVASGGFLIGEKNVYDELVSTGNIKLISNDVLKNAIVSYYKGLMNYRSATKIHVSHYLAFLNSIRPFDPNNPNQISKYDQDEAMRTYKTEEFRRNVDSELTYTNTLKFYLKQQEKIGNDLIELIKAKLNHNE